MFFVWVFLFTLKYGTSIPFPSFSFLLLSFLPSLPTSLPTFFPTFLLFLPSLLLFLNHGKIIVRSILRTFFIGLSVYPCRHMTIYFLYRSSTLGGLVYIWVIYGSLSVVGLFFIYDLLSHTYKVLKGDFFINSSFCLIFFYTYYLHFFNWTIFQMWTLLLKFCYVYFR